MSSNDDPSEDRDESTHVVENARKLRRETKRARARLDLLGAAVRVTDRVGAAGLSIRAIAIEAGCATGLLSYYFPGGINEILVEVGRVMAAGGDDKAKGE